MSFLTAASERSRSGSGVSGVSAPSFSDASFSFSFAAALVLLAMHCSLNALRGARRARAPYPMREDSHGRRDHSSPPRPVPAPRFGPIGEWGGGGLNGHYPPRGESARTRHVL